MSKADTDLVLITGSSGRLGTAAAQALMAAGHLVRGFDLRPGLPLSHFIQGNLSQPELLQEAVQGVSTLIHLAATPDDVEGPEGFLRDLVPNNIIGLYHVLEAARTSGVRRVILASSGQVNWRQQYHGALPITTQDAVTPRHWYAATKMFMESAGFSYAQNCGATVIAVRLGWCPRRGQADDFLRNETAQDLYFSPGDAGRFFQRTVEADVPQGFHLLYATSRPIRRPIFDILPALALLGWKPMDQWPTGAEDGPGVS